ncbi:uncharacterized mitochondrial protein-like protein [Tanacetum coccineum]
MKKKAVSKEGLEQQLITASFGKHLEEIHTLYTQFGKKQDKIASLLEGHSRFGLQTVKTASQFHVTTSKHSRDDIMIHIDDTSIIVYVDDILITCKDKVYIDHIKQLLHQTFSIKDLGALNYYLRIEFLRNSTGLAMTQRKYTLDLLKLAGVLDSKPYHTLIEPNTKLNLTDGTPLPDHTLYRTLVGKLIYLTVTRPNISFVA